MRFKAVLFDLDGTLLDTLEDLADCMNRVLARRSFPEHPIDAYRYFVGQGIDHLIQATVPRDKQEPQLIKACRTDFQEEYGEHWADKTGPYEGVPELLDALTDQATPMSILSNKPDQFVGIMVDRYFENWSFEHVLGVRDGYPRKPNPAVPLEICADLNLKPQDVLYLGDTDTDMTTARAAGMFAAGALWGFRPREELEESGAQAFLHRPQELLELF
jgi:phosphoglycolate phosphatase